MSPSYAPYLFNAAAVDAWSRRANGARGSRQGLLARCILVALGMSPAIVMAAPGPDPIGEAGAFEFSSAFTGSGQPVDVSRFERGNPVLSGTYNVDVFVNEARIGRRNILFRMVEGSNVAQACFDRSTLVQMGVDLAALDAQVAHPLGDCIGIEDVSADAYVRMSVAELRLDVSIPQQSLKREARGYVGPEQWEQGETAFLLGYNFNAYSLNQSYAGSRGPGYGSAVTEDGSRVQVQGDQFYVPGVSGGYTESLIGTYMLGADGQYVPVKRETFSPAQGGGGSNDVTAYLGLNMGVNAGGWRLRSQGSLQWDQHRDTARWDSVNATASHDITRWKAQLTVGDSYTQGTVFDSTAFRGATVYSDDRMLPDSQQGYAPVVRGFANTQARVEVRQSGSLLYQTTVAPGAFVIDDLYATGYGGDLDVTVFEADGSRRSFVVPYSAVPMLLRPGMDRWSVTAGQVRNEALRHELPRFVEGTYQRGINNWLTVYGGVQATHRELYRSYLGGAAINTPLGAFALDITNSHASFDGLGKDLSGYSYRASYSKAVPTSGTTFALASYRYSNGNYLSLTDTVSTQDMMTSMGAPSLDLVNAMRQKQRLNVTINQRFSDNGGQVYLNGFYSSYWNGQPNATTYQLGYNNTWKRVNLGLTASRTYTAAASGRSSYDNQFGLNLSIPLGGTSQRRSPQLSLNASHDEAMGDSQRLGVTGAFGESGQFNYGANATHSEYNNSSSQTTASGSMGWQAPLASVNASYSYASNYQQSSVSASGGLVAHSGGITLSPQLDLNGAIGIIEAQGAAGARVSSSGQAKVDGRGYAIATSLMPYRMNDVTLDPAGTSNDVELDTTRLQVAPRAGAVIPLKFETTSGRAALIRATQPDGQSVPFGAEVLDAEGRSVGVVGQGGQIFVRGPEAGGTLLVRWGDEKDSQCHVGYTLPARGKGAASAVEVADGVCR